MSTHAQQILALLAERDARENLPFAQVIAANSHLLQLLAKNQASSTTAKRDQERTKQLEKKIEELQEELTSTYKKEAKEATSQLAMEAESRQVQQREAQTKEALERTKEKLREALAQLEEETRVCARSREETTQMRDELLRVRRMLERSEGRVRELTKENESLVNRMLAEKARLAEELNRLTQIYDEVHENYRRVTTATPVSTLQGSSAATTSPGTALNTKGPLKLDKPGLVVDSDATAQAQGQQVDQQQQHEALDERVPCAPVLYKFRAHESEIPGLRLDERGAVLATAGCDGSIGIWDAFTGEAKMRLQAPQEDVSVLSVDVKMQAVLGAGSDRAARLWSLDTGRVEHTLTGHTSKVYAARLTLDAKLALTGGTDRKAMIWDTTTGYRLRIISCGSICNSLAVGSDGSLFATGHQDRMIRLWDCRTGKMAMTISDVHESAVTSVEFAGGNNLVSTSRDNSVCLLDMTTGKAVKRFTHPDYKAAFNWTSADCSPSRGLVAAPSANGKIYVWSTVSGKCVAEIGGEGVHDTAVSAVAWNPMGQGRLVSCDKNGIVALWGGAAR